MATKILKSHDDVMKCVEASNVRVDKIEGLTKGVPALVETLHSKLLKGSEEIKSIGCRVTQNRKGIDELEVSIKKMQDGSSVVFLQHCNLETRKRCCLAESFTNTCNL